MKLGLVMIVAFLIGAMLTEQSYEEAIKEAEHYTDMVCRGYWPDYDKRAPDCADYFKGE